VSVLPIPSPPSSRAYRRSGGDKTRRGRWLDAVAKAPISRGACAWALTLAQRSNATAKPVWGYQTGQAKAIGCSDRQVRRYRAELEQAGLIETVRGEVERRHDGTIARTMTNLYRFLVGPLVRRKKSSSHRPDIHDRSNPSLTGHRETFRDTKWMIVDDWLDPSDLSDCDPWQLASV
jgi:hypothetical protein